VSTTAGANPEVISRTMQVIPGLLAYYAPLSCLILKRFKLENEAGHGRKTYAYRLTLV
jgi:hypothetical protein